MKTKSLLLAVCVGIMIITLLALAGTYLQNLQDVVADAGQTMIASVGWVKKIF